MKTFLKITKTDLNAVSAKIFFKKNLSPAHQAQ